MPPLTKVAVVENEGVPLTEHAVIHKKGTVRWIRDLNDSLKTLAELHFGTRIPTPRFVFFSGSDVFVQRVCCVAQEKL